VHQIAFETQFDAFNGNFTKTILKKHCPTFVANQHLFTSI